MTEYIISTTNMPEHVLDAAVAAWIKEEIVRCRDCHWSKPEQSDHEYRAERHCNIWSSDVSADGFCWRGERRDV